MSPALLVSLLSDKFTAMCRAPGSHDGKAAQPATSDLLFPRRQPRAHRVSARHGSVALAADPLATVTMPTAGEILVRSPRPQALNRVAGRAAQPAGRPGIAIDTSCTVAGRSVGLSTAVFNTQCHALPCFVAAASGGKPSVQIGLTSAC